MTGRQLVQALATGTPLLRRPYIPLLGQLALVLGQVPEDVFRTDPQLQARALLETALSVQADVITAGALSEPEVGVDVARRLRALAPERGIAGCVQSADVAAVRAYCEAGVDMIFLISPDQASPQRLKTIGNACSFYSVPAILFAPELKNAACVAHETGLHGAVVARPDGREPGIIGGGLSQATLAPEEALAPRSAGFFWTFPGEAPAGASPEDHAELGTRLNADSSVGMGVRT